MARPDERWLSPDELVTLWRKARPWHRVAVFVLGLSLVAVLVAVAWFVAEAL